MNKDSLRRLASDEEGGQAVEYGLIMGVVAVALIAALVLFREKIFKWFGIMGDKVVDDGNMNN